MNSFILSKILWFIVSPLNFILILLTLSYIISFFKKTYFFKIFYYFAMILILFTCILPTGSYLNYLLEKDFHFSNYYPDSIDGILILSGATNPFLTQEHNQVVMNGSAERLTESIFLIKKYPNAKVVFSGGSGSLKYPSLSHASAAKKFFIDMNIAPEKIIYEKKSRNTYENILFSKALINPKINEKWLVVTSAFHLRRVMAISEKLEWNIIPYATDFNSSKSFFQDYTFNYNFISNLSSFNHSLHEWLGLIAYYYMGRSVRI